MTPQAAMKIELDKALQEQAGCKDRDGRIIEAFRDFYFMQVGKAKAYKDSIDWLNNLYKT